MTTVRVLLTVALVISLLALGHHPLAHARHGESNFSLLICTVHLKFVVTFIQSQVVVLLISPAAHMLLHAVKDPSMPTGDSSSVKKGLQQGSTMKLDAGKTKKVKNVGVEEIQKGSAEPSFGNRGSLGVESDKVAVLARRGEPPKPHPKKHN
ncbi:unnamed protein product [Triticum turgidum subsp. durum]|uniref:Uncharacterized protein n=1 Tax=Triticum turgidum subsp. durum TaxID=4567 RepID=A0A9R0WF45_TRITD|nr:unnamed protein product [Triticum turgidum subsp. durum]